MDYRTNEEESKGEGIGEGQKEWKKGNKRLHMGHYINDALNKGRNVAQGAKVSLATAYGQWSGIMEVAIEGMVLSKRERHLVWERDSASSRTGTCRR